MMESHNATRIDQHIPTLLPGVSHRPPWKLPTDELLEVGPPRCRPPEMSQSGLEHAVGPIDVPLLVDQDGPRKPGLVEIGTDQWATLKRHDHKLHVERAERILDLLQLQQVSAAGQSTQMAMEDHQQPGSLEVLESMDPAVDVWQCKRHGGLVHSGGHGLIIASYGQVSTQVHSAQARLLSPRPRHWLPAFIHDVDLQIYATRGDRKR